MGLSLKMGLGMDAGLGAVVHPSALFWVGGTGNWSQASHWALTSGGTGGAGLPGRGTAVTFDSNSGTSATVTVDVAAVAKSITINKSDLTLSDSAGITLSGTFTLTTGALNTGGHTENWGLFVSSGTAARTFTITNSTINLTSSNGLNTITATNMAATLTGSTINITGFSSTFVPGTLAFPNVVFSGGGSLTAGTGTYGNLTILGNNSQLFDNVAFPGTLTITGTLTIHGFSQANRVLLVPGSFTVFITITAANVDLQNVEFKQIVGAGAATWSGTALGDVGGNTNITFTTPATLHWIGNSGSWSDPAHWSLSSGGVAANLIPLPQDTALFDSGSFTLPGQSVTMNYSEYSAMDWTGVTNTPNMLLSVGGNFCGSVTLAAGMTTGATAVFNQMTFFKSSGVPVLTTNGVGFAAGIQVQLLTGSLTLGSDFVQTAIPNAVEGLVVNAGTFNANDHNVTLLGPVTATGARTRAITMGAGTWTLADTSGTIWNAVAGGMTLTAGSSTIKVASASPTGNRTFAGGGLTYNKFEWGAEGVASTLLVTGTNTFADFKVDADTVARTLTMPSSVTNTSTTIELTGASGAILTLNSSTSGTAATLSASSTVTNDFISVQDSTAAGVSAPFHAGANSTLVSGNTNWLQP